MDRPKITEPQHVVIDHVRNVVEIDGEPYWDGGFTGNPTITPLIRECESDDTILVSINPIERPGTPRTAMEIQNRLNEISFNSPLIKELRMAALLRQVADPGTGEGAVERGRVEQIPRRLLHLEAGQGAGVVGPHQGPQGLALRKESARQVAADVTGCPGKDYEHGFSISFTAISATVGRRRA